MKSLCAVDNRKCEKCSGSKRDCPAYYLKIEGEFGSYDMMDGVKFANVPRIKVSRSLQRESQP